MQYLVVHDTIAHISTFYNTTVHKQVEFERLSVHVSSVFNQNSTVVEFAQKRQPALVGLGAM